MNEYEQAVDGEAFSAAWVEAWNRHDVDAVLEYFHDDVLFTSPVAARIMPETAGVLHGKAAVREYWVKALTLVPDLHFTVEAVHEGIAALVITYRNQRGVLVNEVLHFSGRRVKEGHVTYPAGVAFPADMRSS